jgi:hypothetical protein
MTLLILSKRPFCGGIVGTEGKEASYLWAEVLFLAVGHNMVILVHRETTLAASITRGLPQLQLHSSWRIRSAFRSVDHGGSPTGTHLNVPRRRSKIMQMLRSAVPRYPDPLVLSAVFADASPPGGALDLRTFARA